MLTSLKVHGLTAPNPEYIPEFEKMIELMKAALALSAPKI